MRNLYRVKEGRVVSRVCGGLTKYFNVDPKMVRRFLVLLVAALSTGLIANMNLMFFMSAESNNNF